MKTWKKVSTGLAATFVGLTPAVWAQPPAPPVPAAAAAAPAAPAPTTLWSFLGLSVDQMQACKVKVRDCLCNCPLGQMLNNTMKPIGALSGGMLPPFCPVASPADLAKAAQPGNSEGAAAKIKAAEAEAKA